MLMRLLSSLLLMSSLVSNSAFAYEEAVPRYALVIGNSGYRHAPLKNTVNDARDMAAALGQLEYKVTLKIDLRQGEFVDVVKQFYGQVKSKNSISIFYYAGHAVQVENTNYLIPVQSAIQDIATLRAKSFALSKLLYIIKNSPGDQNIIVLDACRDNPFRAQGASTTGNVDQFAGLLGGLAPVEAPANTLVAYSTEPGNVASDGAGRNGAYTAALLKHIAEPILAEELFKKVRKDVIKATKHRQTPWEHSSLTHRFYFGPPVNEEISDIVSF
jgi:uncharacterized caspase-like protein